MVEALSQPRKLVAEERLIPVVRARLAERLARDGLRVREIAQALRVTQPAVTQYLKGRRGTAVPSVENIDGLVGPLAERLVKRIRSGLGTVETAELLETAHQAAVMSGEMTLPETGAAGGESESLQLLRQRLKLELAAAEKYVELANGTSDDYTKLLLRMVAADSIRHGDVVSQIISLLAAGGNSSGSIPDDALLKSMLSIEDSAGEVNLKANVKVRDPVARLLLQWIDMDEKKHEKIVGGLLRLSKHRG